MKRSELKVAVEILDEDQLLTLGTYYEGMLGSRDEDTKRYYRLRLDIVEQEMGKDERPKVNRKLAQKPNFWKGL